MKNFKHSLLGFTLIELLLVITILSVIIALMLSSYQQRTANLKVQKTALQMQQILQAASTFYQEHGTWPTTDDANFKNNYLPVGLQTNPWGTNYSYLPINKIFRIYSGMLSNTQLATRIVSLLPNAIVDPISHRQAIMMSQIQPSTYDIKVLGFTPPLCDAVYGSNCRKTVTFSINCPTGTPQVIVYPSFIDADYLSFDPGGSNEISTLNTTPASCTAPDRQGNAQCTIQVYLSTSHGQPFKHPPHNLGSGIFTYIGYCYNPGTTSQLFTKTLF